MIVLLLSLLAVIPLPAKPQHYVTDNAGVLGSARADALDAKLKEFERTTSDQVIVYVDRRVPEGTTMEEMSAQAIHAWGVGQKGKDNGAILWLFTDDRKMRIEVGYGLEGSLTDAKSKEITSTVMKPLLKAGDTAGAVEAGVDAMLAAIRGEAYRGTGRTVAETQPSSGLGIFLLVGCVSFLLIPGAIVLAIIAKRRGWITATSTGGSWSWSSGGSSSDSSSDSSSSSSDSSSDFSSGGGDGGGGGSSDSW